MVVTSCSPGRTPARKETPARRDPLAARARLLQAAVDEFSAHGYSGARTERIAQQAGTNIRMLYHYFGGKDDLYVVVLETVLADLRHDELQLDTTALPPMEGLLRIFDFVAGHFAAHPQLRKLLAFENLNEARHLARSDRIPEMATPVLNLIRKLLARGAATGEVRQGVDALQLYVAMVSLSYYGRAHAFTLTRIFNKDLQKPSWQRAHLKLTRAMVEAYLSPDD
ncbi:MAG: TetR family transcriptional regulator [Burkholderiales bacterium]|nr:TetR family transcriptional regulator [Burkholderiales bacterium]